jgi:acetyl esterase/lipase
MMRQNVRVRWWIGLLLAALVTVAAFTLSPRPTLAILVWQFDRGAAQASQALAPRVPAGVQTLADQPVDGPWPDLRFELHRPDSPAPPGGRALLVWIHGGGWVSGRKEDVANYLRIVAARSGLAVASLDYTLAPEAVHPTQLQQVHAGLFTLRVRAEALGIDPQRIVLAGDSAGAQLAAQLAAAITHPEYGQRLGVPAGSVDAQAIRGVALFCGPYDLGLFNLEGKLGPVLRAVLWAFTGERDARATPAFELASVLRHVTADFPPAFITVGNADPLKAHSLALEARLRTLGVPVQTLYFADDRTPPLGHEYQFNLDDPAGEEALQRLLAFLAERLR